MTDNNRHLQAVTKHEYKWIASMKGWTVEKMAEYWQKSRASVQIYIKKASEDQDTYCQCAINGLPDLNNPDDHKEYAELMESRKKDEKRVA